jgi:2'-5' RNA ligase
VSASARERVRLFVALDLPDEIRRALTEWRSGLDALRPLRLVDPRALHATLCFLGWRFADEATQIGATCDAVLRHAAGPSLSLGEILWLPPRKPRVLAVRLEDSTSALRELQASLSAALSSGGWYEPEKRPYLAHVTLARVPGRSRVRPVELTPPQGLGFVAPSVTLYRSRLERGGARYESLARVELA